MDPSLESIVPITRTKMARLYRRFILCENKILAFADGFLAKEVISNDDREKYQPQPHPHIDLINTAITALERHKICRDGEETRQLIDELKGLREGIFVIQKNLSHLYGDASSCSNPAASKTAHELWLLCPEIPENFDSAAHSKNCAVIMAQLIYQTKGLAVLHKDNIPKSWRLGFQHPSLGVHGKRKPAYFLTLKRGSSQLMLGSRHKSDNRKPKTTANTAEKKTDPIMVKLKALDQKITSTVVDRGALLASFLIEHKLELYKTIGEKIQAAGIPAGTALLEPIEVFTSNWAGMIQSAPAEEVRKRYLLFYNADPSILFPATFSPSFHRKKEELPGLYGEALGALKTAMPFRDEVCEALLRTIFRRLLGDSNASYPLLVGIPATGKSEMARQVGAALTSAGLPTTVIFQSMTLSNYGHNQVEACLLGTQSHYSNADSGKIYKNCVTSSTSLCLIVLDEADKHQNSRELLVQLLDPMQPLQDVFASSICNDMDMRDKTLFILTANTIATLKSSDSDPLWSRLAPLHLEPYSQKRLVDLLTVLAAKQYQDTYPLTEHDYRNHAQELVRRNGDKLSVRQYLDQIGDLASQSIFPSSHASAKALQLPKARRIGF